MYVYDVSIQMSGGSPRAKVVLYAGSVFKLFIVVLHNFCYHGKVMSHFSSLSVPRETSFPAVPVSKPIPSKRCYMS